MSDPGTGTAPTSRRRVPLWDNARWVAITLVVVGHAILKLISESDVAYSVYLFIYTFHVPVFVAVSGYFAKSGPPGVRQLQRILTDLVFPYLIFETIWTTVRWLLGGDFWLDYAMASWTLWFLIALAIWRMLLPLMVLLRYPLLISIVISVAVGYFPSIDPTLALSRTLGLLPFFIFGWKIRQLRITRRWLELEARDVLRWRAGAVALFLALAVTVTVAIEPLRGFQIRRFLTYNEAYPVFGYDEAWAGGVRLALILLGFAFTVAFLLLMPRRATWFTSLGAATMYIYLLHSFVLFPFRESGILDGPQPWWVLPAMILFAVGVSAMLSAPIIQKVFRPLVQPEAKWVFRRTTPAPTGTHAMPPVEPPI